MIDDYRMERFDEQIEQRSVFKTDVSLCDGGMERGAVEKS